MLEAAYQGIIVDWILNRSMVREAVVLRYEWIEQDIMDGENHESNEGLPKTAFGHAALP